jgi:hypothetical protein
MYVDYVPDNICIFKVFLQFLIEVNKYIIFYNWDIFIFFCMIF